MLDGGGYLNPRMTGLFPNRTDRLHRMRFIEQADWYPRHGWVFRASHEYRRAAFRAEELAKQTTQVGRPIKLLASP